MPRWLVTAALTLLFLAVGAADASAFGPFCFQLTPFPNVVVWFVDQSGPNQFVGSGRDLTANAAQSVQVVISGSIASVTFVTGAGPGPTAVPYVGTTEINLATSSGPGRYSNLRADGVAPGTFTAQAVACPANALTEATPEPGRFPGIAVGATPAPAPPATIEATAGLVAQSRAW
jgi:hypothetical protein